MPIAALFENLEDDATLHEFVELRKSFLDVALPIIVSFPPPPLIPREVTPEILVAVEASIKSLPKPV